MKHTKKRALAVSLLVVLVASAAFAGVAYAQTTNSTSSATTTSTTTNADSARNGPLDMVLGPLLDVFVHNKSMNVTATTETDVINTTHQPLGISGDRCHGAQQEKQGKDSRNSRNAIATWYQQLSTDQKNALQSNLKEAYNNWYSQLPQDQKDKLQSVLNQTSETQ